MPTSLPISAVIAAYEYLYDCCEPSFETNLDRAFDFHCLQGLPEGSISLVHETISTFATDSSVDLTRYAPFRDGTRLTLRGVERMPITLALELARINGDRAFLKRFLNLYPEFCPAPVTELHVVAMTIDKTTGFAILL